MLRAMASHDSAIKKHRQDEKRRGRNRQHLSRFRTQLKRFRKAIESGEADTAGAMLNETLSIIDRGAKVGVIHDNVAARTKSRLSIAVNRLRAKGA